jgi:hypothetical protein
LRLATTERKKASQMNTPLQAHSCWTTLAQGLEQGTQGGPTIRSATMPRNPHTGSLPTMVHEGARGILLPLPEGPTTPLVNRDSSLRTAKAAARSTFDVQQ